MPHTPEARLSGAAPRRNPALDGLRGVAILLVYLFHYGGGLRSHNLAARALGYLTQAGWTGVDLFFALSGFLITGLLWQNLGEPNALRNFYARRALRILPLYFGALAIAAAAALLWGARARQLAPILVYVGFLQNIPPLVPLALHYPRPLPLHHLWSLAVEEQFYLLWPFLLLAARSRRRALHLCLWTFALSCAFRALVYIPHLLPAAAHLDWSGFLLTRAGALALGGALALVPLNPARLRRWAVPCLFGGLALFVVAGWHSGTLVLDNPAQFLFGLPAVDLACAALVALALQPGLWPRLLSTPALRLLGRISYGFYVFHVLLEPLFDRLGHLLTHATSGPAYQFARLLVAFPITAVVAWLSFTFFERPFLRLKRRFPRPEPSLALDPAPDPR